MPAPAPQTTGGKETLALVRYQGEQALESLSHKLQGKATPDDFDQFEHLEEAMRNLPDLFLIAVDRTGSANGDLPVIEQRIHEIVTSVGKEDCPVVMFGDAQPDRGDAFKTLTGEQKLANTILDGNGNRHEGGLQAVVWGLEQKGINLDERTAESPPIHAIILTDEHADGVLGGEIVNATAKTVTEAQVEKIFAAHGIDNKPTLESSNRKVQAVELDFDVAQSSTATNIEQLAQRLKNAHVILHVLTPKSNEIDYMNNSAIHLLGQIWQAIAGLTGGDWADLANEFKAVGGSNLAKTVEDMKQAAIAPIKALLTDGKKVN